MPGVHPGARGPRRRHRSSIGTASYGWSIRLLFVVEKPYQKLSDRLQGLPVTQVLHEGVPDHLEQPLRKWLYAALRGGNADLVALTLEIPIRTGGHEAEYLANYAKDDLLDIADAILHLDGPWPPKDPYDYSGEDFRLQKAFLIKELELILQAGSSFLRLNDEQKGLTRRVDATVTAAFGSASAAAAEKPEAGSASQQLSDAWRELYGVQPDPSAAYSAAIKAVESAAHAVVEPNNTKATLGTMIRALKDRSSKYRLILPGPSGDGDVEVLTKMMQLIWTGQTSRHGAQTERRIETQEEAEMAVHLAVTLVHWFSTGAVVRR